MENNVRYTEKLAKYILLAAGIALTGGICWMFKSVLAYILIAVVVSLIAKPIMSGLQKINIKGIRIPHWLLAAVTLLTVLGLLSTLIILIIPLISSIVKDVSVTNMRVRQRA